MTDKDFFERFVYDSEKDMLGSGGFGTVYKAYDKFEKKYVAIKISQVKDIYGKFTLLNEVELSRKIDHHTNVARYEFGLRVTQPFLIDYAVMDYYEDGNLDMLLKKTQGKLSENERFDILEGILEGLKHLHTEGVIHRDIKLANILMHKTRGGQWRPKIADFGLSRLMDTDDNSVSNSAIGITIAYAAPEQIENRTIKRNVDLWAFGVVLYRLMTGQLPFAAAAGADPTSANLEMSRKIVQVELPKALETLPEPYRFMIQRCFVKDTSLRAQGADELLDILKGKIKIETPVKVQPEIVETPTIIEPLPLKNTQPEPVEMPPIVNEETVLQDIKIEILVEKKAPINVPIDIPTVIEPPKKAVIEIKKIVEEQPKASPLIEVKPIFKEEKKELKPVEKAIKEGEKSNVKKYLVGGASLLLLSFLGYCGFNKMGSKSEVIAVVEPQPTVENNVSVPVAQNTPATPSTVSQPIKNSNTPQSKTPIQVPNVPKKDIPQQPVVMNNNVPKNNANVSTTNTNPPPTPIETLKSNPVVEPDKPKETPSQSLPNPPKPTPIVTPSETPKAASPKVILDKDNLADFIRESINRDSRKELPATVTVHNFKVKSNGDIDIKGAYLTGKGQKELSDKCKKAILILFSEYNNLKLSEKGDHTIDSFSFNL